MTETLLSVGWVALTADGNVVQPMKRKQWYNKSSTPSVRKLYKTESVAKRYGTPKEVFIKVDTND